MIIPIWQNLFESSHLLAKRVGEEQGVPATHTGTLDPMAQGVLVVLTGEDRYKKGSFEDWTKEYTFSILWGVQTDSGDRLGLIQQLNTKRPHASSLSDICERFPTEYEQRIPDFSARRWKGGSAFDQGKLGVDLPVKTKRVTLSALSCTQVSEISKKDLLSEHALTVQEVQGNFRQTQIIENWQDTLKDLPESTTFLLSNHRVTTSVGTYIRQLTQDIAVQVGTSATTWEITRTRNGPYSKNNCTIFP